MWVAEWIDVVFTDETRICLQHHDGRIRVWRHRGERMLNTPHCSCTGYYDMGDIGYHSRTHLVLISGTLNSQCYISEVLKPVVLPYLSRRIMRDHTGHGLSKGSPSITRLNFFPGRVPLRIFRR
ncbi:transposable element Tcb1 transposase [Trichonephila clavipes]|nr:transposable element Tcb1 transposase [Trichonephila clavipes]